MSQNPSSMACAHWSLLIGHCSLLIASPQCRHIDYESIPHIALQHAFVGLIHFLNRDQLDVARDLVFRAEVQHLLYLANTTYLRSCQTSPSTCEGESANRNVFLRKTDYYQRAINSQQLEIGIPVNLRGDRIDDQVEVSRE